MRRIGRIPGNAGQQARPLTTIRDAFRTASVFLFALFLSLSTAFCEEEKNPAVENDVANPIESYRVDKRVSEFSADLDFSADLVDLSTPESAYALGNRIIAGNEADKIGRLRQYSEGMIVPKEIEQWVKSMPLKTRGALKTATILQVFVSKDRIAMVVAEVVKGKEYNNRIFVKQDGRWFNVGGSGLFKGKSAEEVVKMLDEAFVRLADRWDNEKENGDWKTPDKTGHTHLASFEPAGDFKPAGPQELLNKLSGPLFKRKNIMTGYFRAEGTGSNMVGRICTNNPEVLREVFKESPQLRLLKIEPLNERLFEKHVGEKTAAQPPPLEGVDAGTDGGYATPKEGYTHIIVFGPRENFQPMGAADYLSIINPRLNEFGIRAGYFRSFNEDGRLIAYNLTSTPEKYEKLVESIPQLEYLKTVRLTKAMFEKYENTKSDSFKK